MVYFWGAAAAIAVKMERLRGAETALLELALGKVKASNCREPMVRVVDTKIPVSAVPLSTDTKTRCLAGTSTSACDGEVALKNDFYVIHGIEVTSTAAGPLKNDKTAVGAETPLVLLHGYSKYRWATHSKEETGPQSLVIAC
jgi:hypothetical protein